MTESSWFEPHQIGEELLVALVKHAQHCKLREVVRVATANGTEETGRWPFAEDSKWHVNERLETLDGIAFDGMHRVDVVAAQDNASATAIELKLGAAAMSPQSFRRRFLDGSVRKGAHKSPRFVGSMPAILEGLGELKSRRSRLTTHQGQVLAADWYLVLHAEAYKKWARTPWPTTSLKGVICFDDIVDAVGRTDAKEVALGLVTKQVDGWWVS